MTVLWDLLTKQGELYIDSHFVYTSGMHGDGYVNHRFLAAQQFQDELQSLSLMLLDKTIDATDIDTAQRTLLIGPKTLGAKMVNAAADAYNHKHGTSIRYAVIDYRKDEAGNKTYFWSPDSRGIDDVCAPGTQVIWMDDLMNQSSTLRHTREIFENRAPITAAAVFFDRSNFTAEQLGVPAFVWLEKHTMQAYDPRKCPMCDAQMPIRTDLGHGEKFRHANPDYPGGFTSAP